MDDTLTPSWYYFGILESIPGWQYLGLYTKTLALLGQLFESHGRMADI
jgi:hypothetical protein